jgi:hypothetical protein
MKLKHTKKHGMIATLMTILGMANASAATTLWRPDGRPAEGVPYDWVVTMTGFDAASDVRHVGAWSWEDNALFDPGDPTVGWTHTSDWVKLSLVGTTSFTIRLERQSNVAGASVNSLSMFPSFTLWSGWDVDGVQDHTYNNNNNAGPVWAEDLSYIDHFDNSTQSFVERTYSLTGGEYTVALGSNAPATDTERQGYRFTFTTVPEPSTAVLSGLAAMMLLTRRSRRPF